MKQKYKIGLIYLSPEHPEMEIMRRVKVASENIGYECHFITPRGIEIDTSIDISESLDFLFLFDPSHHTYIDSYKYHVHWFCPGIVSPFSELNYAYSSKACDSHLYFPSDKIHLKPTESSLDDDLYLFPSVPKSFCIEVSNKSQYKLFYCGVNNDGSDGIRHSDLFEFLDKNDILEVYGPEEVNGKANWVGIKNFKGSIPFDGKSVIKYAANCGVCLVIQHDLHNIYGMMTNRIFEGCAAGCLIISDDIPFVRKSFGDSVFYLVKKGKSVTEIGNQINSIVSWANENPQEAYEMARKSQQIFLEKYTLEDVLTKIFDSHKKLLSLDNTVYEDIVDIVVPFKDFNSQLMSSISCQRYDNLNVVVLLPEDCTLTHKQIDFLSSKTHQIVKFDKLFSSNEALPIFNLVRENCNGNYVVFANKYECWQSDHISSLLYQIKRQPDNQLVYSGSYIKEEKGLYNTALTFKPIVGLNEMILRLFRDDNQILELSHLLPSSSLLFSKTLISQIKGFDNDILGEPSYAILGYAILNEISIKFSNKITCYINRRNFLDYIDRNANIFPNKSYATPKNAIINVLAGQDNLSNIIHDMVPQNLIVYGHEELNENFKSECELQIKVALDKLEKKLREELVSKMNYLNSSLSDDIIQHVDTELGERTRLSTIIEKAIIKIPLIGKFYTALFTNKI